MGRKAWLFCGSELAGQRAATVMSLVQSAKLHRHDPWVYLKNVSAFKRIRTTGLMSCCRIAGYGPPGHCVVLPPPSRWYGWTLAHTACQG